MSRKSTREADTVIGQRLREARLRAGKTQVQAAELLGITYQQFSKYERGGNRCPPSRLAELAAFYGASIDELIGVGASPLLPNELLTQRAVLELARAASRLSPEQVAALTATARAMTV